jgi:hypothetical protein
MSSSFFGPTLALIPLVAGMNWVVSGGLSNAHPVQVRRTANSVRRAPEHRIPIEVVLA